MITRRQIVGSATGITLAALSAIGCDNGGKPIVTPTYSPTSTVASATPLPSSTPTQGVPTPVPTIVIADISNLESLAIKAYQAETGQKYVDDNIVGDLLVRQSFYYTLEGKILQVNQVEGIIEGLGMDKITGRSAYLVKGIDLKDLPMYDQFLQDPNAVAPLDVHLDFPIFTKKTDFSGDFLAVPVNYGLGVPSRQAQVSIVDYLNEKYLIRDPTPIVTIIPLTPTPTPTPSGPTYAGIGGPPSIVLQLQRETVSDAAGPLVDLMGALRVERQIVIDMTSPANIALLGQYSLFDRPTPAIN